MLQIGIEDEIKLKKWNRNWEIKEGNFLSIKIFLKRKKEKKKKAIKSGLGVLKARFSSKILPEWVEIL